MKKNLALIGVALVGVLLTGCGKNTQPQIIEKETIKQAPSIVVLSKNEKDLGYPEIDESQKNKLLYWIERDVDRDLEGKPFSFTRTIINYDFIYFIDFEIMNNKVIMIERVKCKQNDCSNPRSYGKVNLSISEGEDLRVKIENKTIEYLKGYKIDLSKIKEAYEKVNQLPEISIAKNKYLNKESLDMLSKKLRSRSLSYDKTDLYVRYKKSGKTLENFLSELKVFEIMNFSKQTFGEYRIKEFIHSISFKDYKEKIELSDVLNKYIEFNYIPKIYTASDPKLSIEILSAKSDFYPKITNKTGIYVTIKAISIYYGNNIRTLSINQKIAPGTYNLENEMIIKNDFEKFRNIGQSVSFGVAVEYESAGKIYTLHETKTY